MKSFSQYLEERVISIGLNPKQEVHRERYRQQMHDILRRSYAGVEGGYGGLGSGTEAESKSIHDDINNSIIKATRRNGKITSVNLYKKRYGRKSIALGHDGSDQGKNDIRKTMMTDKSQKRSWSEVSGAVENLRRKMGYPIIPSSRAKELTGKEDIRPIDKERYVRKIGGSEHEKVIMGYPKKD